MSQSAMGLIVAAVLLFPVASDGQTVPTTWDEPALTSALLPPPVAGAIINQVPAAYYYRMRERVMYQIYPVYASKAEPPGYMEKLALVEPEITFDPAKLKTEKDWIAAGRDVYRYPMGRDRGQPPRSPCHRCWKRIGRSCRVRCNRSA